MGSGIYQIRNKLNAKCYIGSAVVLGRRWRAHLSELRRGRHKNGHLQAAFNKYGEEAFGFSVLEYVADASQLIPREQCFLDTIKPEYNMSPTAGSSLGCQCSPETRAKISAAKKGTYPSDETRRKLSEARKGKHPSAETRAKMSLVKSGERNPMYGRTGKRNPMYGKRHSEESRKKMSEALVGRQTSEETRRKLSKAGKGRRHTEETRRKLSLAKMGDRNPNYGKHLSIETRRKLSEAHTGYRHTEEAKRKISAAWTPERREASRKRMVAMNSERGNH